jgi:hypothetical protein
MTADTLLAISNNKYYVVHATFNTQVHGQHIYYTLYTHSAYIGYECWLNVGVLAGGVHVFVSPCVYQYYYSVSWQMIIYCTRMD